MVLWLTSGLNHTITEKVMVFHCKISFLQCRVTFTEPWNHEQISNQSSPRPFLSHDEGTYHLNLKIRIDTPIIFHIWSATLQNIIKIFIQAVRNGGRWLCKLTVDYHTLKGYVTSYDQCGVSYTVSFTGHHSNHYSKPQGSFQMTRKAVHSPAYVSSPRQPH